MAKPNLNQLRSHPVRGRVTPAKHPVSWAAFHAELEARHPRPATPVHPAHVVSWEDQMARLRAQAERMAAARKPPAR